MNINLEVESAGTIRLRLEIRGVVQGVGFRPYVYHLAQQYGVAGHVHNSATGAVVEVEGRPEAVESFAMALPVEIPPLARVDAIARFALEPLGETHFLIRESDAAEAVFALVPPDICVCDACLAEVMDPEDRRHLYPFANCINCGPRYSIIEDVPYDRARTTMAEFPMCAACQREYNDPADRRFHAQPNACPVCGPRISLSGSAGLDTRTVLKRIAELLSLGKIVAWKGLGGYQLVCDARQDAAVRLLRRRKRRSKKPFAVMVGDVAAAERLFNLSAPERELLTSRERPIVLLQSGPELRWTEVFSPGCATVGVMLPCTPMHALLFRILQETRADDAVLVMTSGNVSEEPIVIDNDEAEHRLAGIADAFVHHNRRIHTRVDDSVARIFAGSPLILRRARGFVPQPILLARGDAEILACGAQQKSTFCLTKSGFALLSQHLGDLENFETLEFYEQTLERMQRLFHVRPTVVAHDLHPAYMSTQLAMRLPADQRVAVQHHHAHIASCMAEHGLEGPVIGIAWDGTGLGTDGTIWGGEFLVADYAGFERYAHLRNVLLAGGDAAVREPWRVARSYLMDAFDNNLPASLEHEHSQSAETVQLLDTMLRKRIRTIETSSCGRLFDAVASLCGLHPKVSYEGQAAVALEAIASNATGASYAFALEEAQHPFQIDLRPMVREVVADLRRGVSRSEIAARFHTTLAAAAVAVCKRMHNRLGLRRVCLSGGCFQNDRLLSLCVRMLRADGFEVFYQQRIPANDGGIALGQAAIACERLRH